MSLLHPGRHRITRDSTQPTPETTRTPPKAHPEVIQDSQPEPPETRGSVPIGPLLKHVTPYSSSITHAQARPSPLLCQIGQSSQPKPNLARRNSLRVFGLCKSLRGEPNKIGRVRWGVRAGRPFFGHFRQSGHKPFPCNRFGSAFALVDRTGLDWTVGNPDSLLSASGLNHVSHRLCSHCSPLVRIGSVRISLRFASLVSRFAVICCSYVGLLLVGCLRFPAGDCSHRFGSPIGFAVAPFPTHYHYSHCHCGLSFIGASLLSLLWFVGLSCRLFAIGSPMLWASLLPLWSLSRSFADSLPGIARVIFAARLFRRLFARGAARVIFETKKARVICCSHALSVCRFVSVCSHEYAISFHRPLNGRFILQCCEPPVDRSFGCTHFLSNLSIRFTGNVFLQDFLP